MIETAQNPCDPEACERIPAAEEHGKNARLPDQWPELDVERLNTDWIIAVRSWLARKHRTKERMMGDLAAELRQYTGAVCEHYAGKIHNLHARQRNCSRSALHFGGVVNNRVEPRALVYRTPILS